MARVSGPLDTEAFHAISQRSDLSRLSKRVALLRPAKWDIRTNMREEMRYSRLVFGADSRIPFVICHFSKVVEAV